MQKENRTKGLKSLHWIFLFFAIVILFPTLAASEQNITNASLGSQINNTPIENYSIPDISIQKLLNESESFENNSEENIPLENVSIEDISLENFSIENITPENVTFENISEVIKIEVNETLPLSNLTGCVNSSFENCSIQVEELIEENITFEVESEPEIFGFDANLPEITFITPNEFFSTQRKVLINASFRELDLRRGTYVWNASSHTFFNESLVLYYNFNNISALGESNSFVLDISSKKNNGTPLNGTLSTSSGKHLGGFAFDGNNDYIEVVNSASLDLNNELSISFWIYPLSWGASGVPGIISKRDTYAGMDWELFYATGETGTCSGELCFWFGNSGEYQTLGDVNAVIPLSTWTHVILSKNGQDFSVYFNGTLIGSQNTAGTIPSGDRVRIGYLGGGSGSTYFNGTLDELQIWNASFDNRSAYLLYASNLNQYNTTDYRYYVNQTKNQNENLDFGTYTYSFSLTDSLGNSTTSEQILTITSTEIGSVLLNSSSGSNLEGDNLSAELSGLSPSNASVNYDFRINNASILLANLPFDSLPSCGNSANFTCDFSTNKFNGSVSTNTSYSSTGGYNGRGAYVFDGVNSDDGISLGEFNVGTNFSISAWIYPTGFQATQGIVTKWHNTAEKRSFAFGIYDTNKTGFYLSSAGSNYNRTFGGSELVANQWYHVVLSYNGSGIEEGVAIYINGVRENLTQDVGFGTYANDTIFQTDSEVYIGRHDAFSGSPFYFQGTIDEVKIYNRSISYEQVLALYENNTHFISSEETNVGESWSVCATPFYDSTPGERVCSDEITTQSSATPTLHTTLIYPTTNINVSQHAWFNFTVNVSCTGGNCGEVNVTLDPETTLYNFTTCGNSGRLGPSQINCTNSYSGTTLDSLVSVSGGIQNWTVPSSGTYTIKALGASGVQGGSTSGSGGEGAYIVGDFSLTQGDVLQILVGQKGSRDGTYGGGGGGGTFVINSNSNDILLIAGGGGGASIRGSTYTNGRNASINVTGVYGSIDSVLDSNAPGTNGNGGASSTNGGGGGGGYIGNGAGYPAGLSFTNGGTGGTGNAGFSYGGFGGGAGGYGGGGGGGGYNGGGAGGYAGNGGGGGGGSSVNNGTNQNNTILTEEAHGYVLIQLATSIKGGKVPTDPNATPFYTNGTNPTTITLNSGESSLLTWYVNATGDLNLPFEFFAYVNQTSNTSLNNESERLNITIIDTTAPVVSITYPEETTYNIGVSTLNYTYIETNPGSCWYSTNNGATNSSAVSGAVNFSEVSSSEGSNTWRVYCNDSSGNEHFDSVTFTKETPSITLEVVTPPGNVNVTKDEFFSVEVSVGCENANCGEVNVTLDPVTIYNFTTCGATGRLGPSQANCDSAYSGTTLDGLVGVGNGIQNWTVPHTGSYIIEVFGAQGGRGGSYAGNNPGGLGARMKGSFDLVEGQVLQILVGQEGGSHTTYGGGGGGGSFVANGSNYASANPLIIAGGGGGGGVVGPDASNATDETSGFAGGGSSPGAGGTSGNGGVSDTSYGGGGGGFYTSGSAGISSGRGYGFRQGGAGAFQRTGGMPGFGGGAAAHGGAGGGGGYSGGGGGDWSNAGFGGGAGSFNNGVNQDNSPAVREGSGYVTITSSGEKGGTVSMVVGTTPFYTTTTNPYNVTLNEDQTISITWLVNASGDADSSYEFFVYANQTADQSINTESEKWNVTIVTFNVTILPTVTIVTPQDSSFTTNSGLDVNFTTGSSTDSCWYSDVGSSNTSLSNCMNITSVTWSEGEHNVTIWVNDSEGQIASRSVVFTLDTLAPSLSVVFPENGSSTLESGLNVTFSAIDVNLDSCWYSNDSMSTNTSLSNCANITSPTWNIGSHNVTIWANDSSGNMNSTSVYFTIIPPDVAAPNITIISPTNNTFSLDVNLNVTFSIIDDTSLDSCWYNNGSLISNTSLSNCANITTIVWSQGDHNISIWANDSTGNVRSERVFFTVDSLNPQISFQTNTTSSGYFSQTFIRANVSAIDSHLENITINLYNASELISSYTSGTSPANVTFYDLLEGTYYLNATAIDTLGNLNSTETRTIVLDTTSPQTTISSPIDRFNTTSNTQTFTFSQIDATSASCTLYMDKIGFVGNVSISSNASVVSETSTTLTASNLENRTHLWYVECIDLAGNSNATAARNLTVDQVPPQITITTPSANATLGQVVYVRTDIIETLTRVDSAWYYMLNTTNPSEILHSGNLNASSLWDGSWNTSTYPNAEWNVTFIAYANDSLGNSANESISFFVDNVNPIIQLIAPPASTTYYKTNFSLDVPIQDATLNYTYYQITKEGSTWQENSTVYGSSVTIHDWNENVNVSAMEDGTYNATFYAEDESGNSRTVSTLFIVDKNAPSITLDAPLENEYFDVNNVTFNWTATDSISTSISCDLLIDGSVIQSDISCTNNSRCSYGLGGFSSAVHSWNVSCIDDALNQGSATSTFVVDSLAPAISFASPSLAPGSYAQNYIFVNVSVLDVNLNTTIIRLYNASGILINSSSSSASSLYVNFTNLEDGYYSYNASVNDSAGNMQSTTTRTILLDATLPTLSIVTPQNGSKFTNSQVDVNFSAVDVRLDSCWYSNDSMRTNTSLSSCANISLSFSEGEHNFSIWANDSVGNENNANVTFFVDSILPSIRVVSPANGSAFLDENTNVTFSVSDANLDSCWYNNGSISVNTSLANCANITSVVWSEGMQNVTLWVNDTYGNINSTNVSFSIDTLAPIISIANPSNNATSYDVNLNITFMASDENLDSCWYSDPDTFLNSTLSGCANITEATWIAGSYNITIWANDTVGNTNSSNLTFTISAPDITAPIFNFTSPTLANASFTSTQFALINMSITDDNLLDVVYEWNATNQTLFNSSAVLLLNLNNNSAFNESNSYVFDASGNENHGSASGVVSTTSGKYGGAFDFDSDNFDSINVSDSAELNMSTFTVSAWINADTWRTEYYQGSILNKDFDSGGSTLAGFFFRAGASGRLSFGIRQDGNADGDGQDGEDTWVESVTSAIMSTNNWHHVVGVYNGTNVTTYIDGIQRSSSAASNYVHNPGPLMIGNGYDLTRGFNGQIDEVMIWNTHLSSDQIYALYRSNVQKNQDTQWHVFVNQTKNATSNLDDGNYSYAFYASDTFSNSGASANRLVVVDTLAPTWSGNFTNVTSDTARGDVVSFNISVVDLHPGKYIFSFYNGSAWVNNSAQNYTSSNSIQVLKTSPIHSGQLNWTWYFNDSAGNVNQSDAWSMQIVQNYTAAPSWQGNKTNITLNAGIGSSVYFNITLNETDPDKYIFSFYNGSAWINNSPQNYTNGEEVSVTKTITRNAELQWKWYINNTYGNTNVTDTWSFNVINYLGCVNLSDPTTFGGRAELNQGLIEVNSNITLCSGRYTSSSDFIQVIQRNVNIDCNASVIVGNDNNIGIDVLGKTNVNIHSCTFQDFTHAVSYRNRASGNIFNNTFNSTRWASIRFTTVDNSYIFNNSYINSVKGIRIHNSDSNTILENFIQGGSDYGIELTSSDSNIIFGNNITQKKTGVTLDNSDNNNVTGNRISQMSYSGVYLKNSAVSNIIYDNFINTTTHVIDTSESNSFSVSLVSGTNINGDSLLGGNLYTNPTLSGFSDNCEDQDNNGICDDQRNFTSGNDLYPLVGEDSTAPSLALKTPAQDSYVNGNVTIEVDSSDKSGISNVVFYYYNSSIPQTLLCNATSTYSCLWDTTEFGDSEPYTFNITSYDNRENSASILVNYSVDKDIPLSKNIRVTYPSNQERVKNNDVITLGINVSDATGSGINLTRVNLTLINGSGVVVMENVSGSTLANSWSYWQLNVSVNSNNGTQSLPISIIDLADPANTRSSDRFYVLVDTFPPTYDSINNSGPSYVGEEVTYTLNVYDGLLKSYSFETNTSGSWMNISNGTLSGSASSISVSDTPNNGSYGYRWHIFDSAGNVNSTPVRSDFIFDTASEFTDTDLDGIYDNEDTLLFGIANVSRSGLTNLSLRVDNSTDLDSYSGRRVVEFFDSNQILVNFTHNFSRSSLDLRNITIIKTANSLVVNFSGQLLENKTLYVEDNDFISLCVKDAEIASASEISDDCDGAGEIDFTSCIDSSYSESGISCVDLGDYIKVSNLQYSGIEGVPASNSEGSSSGSTSSSLSSSQRSSRSSDSGYTPKEYSSNSSQLIGGIIKDNLWIGDKVVISLSGVRYSITIVDFATAPNKLRLNISRGSSSYEKVLRENESFIIAENEESSVLLRFLGIERNKVSIFLMQQKGEFEEVVNEEVVEEIVISVKEGFRLFTPIAVILVVLLGLIVFIVYKYKREFLRGFE